MKNKRQQSVPFSKRNSTLDDATNSLKAGFDVYNKEKLNIEELLHSMKQGGLNSKHAVIFDMLTELGKKNTEVDFDTYISACNRVLGDRKTNDGLERMFKYFKNNKSGEALSSDELKDIAEELEMDIDSDEFKDLFSEITSDEFKQMMSIK